MFSNTHVSVRQMIVSRKLLFAVQLNTDCASPAVFLFELRVIDLEVENIMCSYTVIKNFHLWVFFNMTLHEKNFTALKCAQSCGFLFQTRLNAKVHGINLTYIFFK